MYNVKNALFAREKTEGGIVASPTVLQICVTEFGLKEERDYTEIDPLCKEGTIEVEGKSKVSGGLKFSLEANTIGFTMSHLMGEKISVEPWTTDTWSASTVMAVGDQMNTADGKWTLTVTRVNGTANTGATEPIPTEKGEVITDNEVVFMAESKLLKIVYPIGANVPKFRAEMILEKVSDGTLWKKQFHNLELDKYPISINGDGVHEVSVDSIGGIAVDEDSLIWTKSFMEETGAVLVLAGGEYLGGSCDLTKVEIDGADKTLDSIEVTIDKGLSEIDLTNCKKRTTRNVSIKGKLDVEFSPEEYANFRGRKAFEFKTTIKTKSGSSMEWIFPNCVPKHKDPDYKSKSEVLLSPDFTVQPKNDTTALCTVTVVVPSLVNSATGAIIGDGSW